MNECYDLARQDRDKEDFIRQKAFLSFNGSRDEVLKRKFRRVQVDERF